MEEVTVKDLRESLANYPDDYKVVINRQYFSDDYNDYGWYESECNEFDINVDHKSKQVELTFYD